LIYARTKGEAQMPHRTVVAPDVFQSAAPYSVAVATEGTHFVHISGQVPQDANGNNIGIGDIDAQADRVLASIKALVEAEGGTMADICRMVIYVTDRASLPTIMEVRKLYFSAPYPANTALVVSGLGSSDWLVEIEATACIAK
jgi:2-iminobutanoate/2-iminopropanoate deaminase